MFPATAITLMLSAMRTSQTKQFDSESKTLCHMADKSVQKRTRLRASAPSSGLAARSPLQTGVLACLSAGR